MKIKEGLWVKVKQTHGYKKFVGDIGCVEKLISFDKAYVELVLNGKQLISIPDLEILKIGHNYDG